MFLKDLLYPEYCVLCNSKGALLCNQCLNERLSYRGPQTCHVCEQITSNKQLVHGICKLNSNLSGVICALNYTEAIRKCISALKYNGVRDISYYLATILQNKYYYSSLNRFIDIIIPLPLSKWRMLERGFNQSELLCRYFEKIDTKSLIKLETTRKQQQLDRSNRKRNVIGSFFVNSSQTVSHKRILLVDDVTTTGATLEAAASALLSSGAKEVYALILAKDNRDFFKNSIE